MVEKVTKEERMATLMKKAAEKAIEILNVNDFNEDDLSGEDVKVKKPKAEKVADAKGGDEQADNRTSRDVKKANPYKRPQMSLREEHDRVARDNKIKRHWNIKSCDSFPDCKNDAAIFSTINCMKMCQECFELYQIGGMLRTGWKPFTVEEYNKHCGD